jgi:hypothetical protein
MSYTSVDRNVSEEPVASTFVCHEVEVAGSPETLVCIHRSTMYYILEDRSDTFLYLLAE